MPKTPLSDAKLAAADAKDLHTTMSTTVAPAASADTKKPTTYPWEMPRLTMLDSGQVLYEYKTDGTSYQFKIYDPQSNTFSVKYHIPTTALQIVKIFGLNASTVLVGRYTNHMGNETNKPPAPFAASFSDQNLFRLNLTTHATICMDSKDAKSIPLNLWSMKHIDDQQVVFLKRYYFRRSCLIRLVSHDLVTQVQRNVVENSTNFSDTIPPIVSAKKKIVFINDGPDRRFFSSQINNGALTPLVSQPVYKKPYGRAENTLFLPNDLVLHFSTRINHRDPLFTRLVIVDPDSTNKVEINLRNQLSNNDKHRLPVLTPDGTLCAIAHDGMGLEFLDTKTWKFSRVNMPSQINSCVIAKTGELVISTYENPDHVTRVMLNVTLNFQMAMQKKAQALINTAVPALCDDVTGVIASYRGVEDMTDSEVTEYYPSKQQFFSAAQTIVSPDALELPDAGVVKFGEQIIIRSKDEKEVKLRLNTSSDKPAKGNCVIA